MEKESIFDYITKEEYESKIKQYEKKEQKRLEKELDSIINNA